MSLFCYLHRRLRLLVIIAAIMTSTQPLPSDQLGEERGAKIKNKKKGRERRAKPGVAYTLRLTHSAPNPSALPSSHREGREEEGKATTTTTRASQGLGCCCCCSSRAQGGLPEAEEETIRMPDCSYPKPGELGQTMPYPNDTFPEYRFMLLLG